MQDKSRERFERWADDRVVLKPSLMREALWLAYSARDKQIAKAVMLSAAEMCRTELEQVQKSKPNPYDENLQCRLDGKIDALEDMESTLRTAAEGL